MRIVLFTHSLVSDWNHGNAHFLRGVTSELIRRGHCVQVFEPHSSWSRTQLVLEQGNAPIDDFHAAYPKLDSSQYDAQSLDLDSALEDADLVIVHEWNPASLVKRIARHRQERGGYVLLFHDTHHRMITQPEVMGVYDFAGYDGVLA